MVMQEGHSSIQQPLIQRERPENFGKGEALYWRDSSPDRPTVTGTIQNRVGSDTRVQQRYWMERVAT